MTAKVYVGVAWQYDNHPSRGRTWAAEATLRGNQGQQFTCYGQKTLKACIAAANKGLALLGWEPEGPWLRIYPQKRKGSKSDPDNAHPYAEE